MEQHREKMIETLAEVDDDVATRYLEGEDLTEKEVKPFEGDPVPSGRACPVRYRPAVQGYSARLDAVVHYHAPSRRMSLSQVITP